MKIPINRGVKKGKQHYYEFKNIYGKKYRFCMSIDIQKNISYLLKKSINDCDFNNFITSINKNKKKQPC